MVASFTMAAGSVPALAAIFAICASCSGEKFTSICSPLFQPTGDPPSFDIFPGLHRSSRAAIIRGSRSLRAASAQAIRAASLRRRLLLSRPLLMRGRTAGEVQRDVHRIVRRVHLRLETSLAEV